MSNLSPGTHRLDVNGTWIVYHVAGAGPVMITHSGGPGIDYGYLRSARLEEHFTMVYPEPAGTGGSGPLPAGATYVHTYVDFLHALVEHLGVPQIFLLGHSHGGFVAERFAMRYPDLVAGLVLYGTSPTTTPDFWVAAQAAVLAYPQRHPDIPETAAVVAAFGQFNTATTAEELTAHLQTMVPLYFADFWSSRPEFKELQDNARIWPTSFESQAIDYRADLAKITARTVVVTGRHDFICGPVWAEMLHRGIPGSRLVILENSGHFGQIEEPDKFLEAVTWLL